MAVVEALKLLGAPPAEGAALAQQKLLYLNVQLLNINEPVKITHCQGF
jgi:hypothetical protein